MLKFQVPILRDSPGLKARAGGIAKDGQKSISNLHWVKIIHSL